MSEFEIVDVTEGDRLITQKEVAARLGTNQAFIKRLLDTNLLPCIRFGRYARISVYALTEFIREHQGGMTCKEWWRIKSFVCVKKARYMLSRQLC